LESDTEVGDPFEFDCAVVGVVDGELVEAVLLEAVLLEVDGTVIEVDGLLEVDDAMLDVTASSTAAPAEAVPPRASAVTPITNAFRTFFEMSMSCSNASVDLMSSRSRTAPYGILHATSKAGKPFWRSTGTPEPPLMPSPGEPTLQKEGS
jgi:hypothetical protein